MDKGKFAWLNSKEVGVAGITKGQLAMLLKGLTGERQNGLISQSIVKIYFGNKKYK